MNPLLRILHLEDDCTDADLVRETLAAGGIASDTIRVDTQASFVAAIASGSFDLIFADYTLPSFDGMAALAIVRKSLPNVPFIFVTGTLGEEPAIEALKLGATDYVFKTRLSRLVPSVQRALREAEERDELERSTDALRRSEAYLAETQRLSDTGSFGWDLSSGELYWSKETLRIFAFDPTTVVTLDMVLQRTHPDDRSAVTEVIERVVRRREGFDFMHRLLMPDQSVKFVRVVGRPSSEDAEGCEFIGAVTDITDRKRIEAALRASEEQFRLIVDGIPGLVVTMTAAGEVELLSRQVMEYFGLSYKEMQPWTANDTVHPEDLPRAIESFAHSVRTGDSYDIEHRLRRFDGVYRWFHARGMPSRDTDGRIARWYLLLTDIEDRKRAECLLAGEKQLLEMVAAGDSMTQVLETLCKIVESMAAGSYCSVVFVDSSGGHLERGIGPSMPESFIASVNGLPVNADSGPCAAAVYLNEQIISSDLAIESRWSEYQWRPMATSHGLRSCWSTPISSTSGRVLGAFAIYYPDPRTPTLQDQALIDQFAHIASIAIERHQAQVALTEAIEGLKTSETRLRTVIDGIEGAVWSTDSSGSVDFLNQRWFDYTGLSPEEAMGSGWIKALHPEDATALASYWALLLRSGQPGEFEARFRRFDGVVRWFLIRAVPIRDKEGHIAKWYGLNIDIDDRKRSEDALQRSERFLAETRRLSLTGGIWRDAVTGESIWSEEVYSIYEIDPSEPSKVDVLLNKLHPEDRSRVKEAMDRSHTLAAAFELPHRVIMSDGRLKYIDLVAHFTRSAEGKLEYIAAIQDVTERELAEQALNNLRSELAHVSRVSSLGALTASIAHEVNQPLSGIITNASTCLRMLAASPPNIDGAVETARRTIRDGNRASDVIKRLRAMFSKRDAITESLDLNEATREVVALALSELQSSSVILRQELAKELPLIKGDRVQLQQVILNLLLNSADAMKAITDRPKLLVIRTERAPEDHVRLTVQDTGVGVEPHRVDKLFEAFYTTKADGMGIGLSVSRSIIERHHGRLWAQPNDGPGATFAFCIPLTLDSIPLDAIRKTASVNATRVIGSL